MSKQPIRFCGFVLVVWGGLGTVVQFAGIFDYGEGSLWLPVAAVIGVVILVVNRPRRH